MPKFKPGDIIDSIRCPGCGFEKKIIRIEDGYYIYFYTPHGVESTDDISYVDRFNCIPEPFIVDRILKKYSNEV